MNYLENPIFISYGIKNGASALSLGIHLYKRRFLFGVRPYVLLFSNNKTPVNIFGIGVVIIRYIIYYEIFILIIL